MFRTTRSWAAFVLLAAAAALFAWTGFTKAFPLVSVDIAMDRSEALARARELAAELGAGPAEPRAAAAFELDSRAQTFLELEGGGPGRVRELIASGPFSLYRWSVRLFRPGLRHELRVSFTPAGEPWGFRETIPEDREGAALGPEAARELAERAVSAGPWGIELADWEEVERSRELRASGRVDQSFTYRHLHADFGAGELRLRLGVSGDHPSEVARFVQVPEAFDRRYEHMRSANEALALVLGATGLGAFLVGGVGLALLLLQRRRLLLWRPALAWGFFVAALQAAALLNAWPLAWTHYDTALSPGLFGGLLLLQSLGLIAIFGPVLALSFVAAEGLARAAFPRHPRLWMLWSRELASTKGVLGRTAAGYLLVALFLAYEVALYLVSSRHLGWWSPVGPLQDPDALATVFPWLNAIASSTQAGFWEEALCRAIPLSAAMLLGRRLGRPRLVVGLALVLQALVFGAAHANYPAQPAYARLVELFLPAVGFGLVFLRFGLLTAVVCHYAYDVLWIALPIFSSSAPGAAWQRAGVLLFAFVPLLIPLLARARSGAWGELRPEHLNGTWRPPAEAPPREPAPQDAPEPLSKGRARALAGLGLAGLAAWLGLARFELDVPSLDVPRSEALRRAEGELAARGVELGADFRTLASVEGEPTDGDRLAWRELGREGYRDFVSDWTDPLAWQVREARFDGELAERAEEWRVAVTATGRARVRHVLPEDRPAPRLGEPTARALALAELERRFDLGAEELELVEAEPSRRPERMDWRLVFRCPSAWPGEIGEARVAVEIAGSEVVRLSRFVHLPEDWARVERERRLRASLPPAVGAVVLVLMLIAAGLGSLVAFAARRFRLRPALAAFALVGTSALLGGWNALPSAMAGASTAQSWNLQLAQTAGGLAAGALAGAAAAALLSGFAHGWLPARRPATWPVSLAAGLGLAGLFAGSRAVCRRLAAGDVPEWGDHSAAGLRLPLLGELLGGWTALVIGGAFLLVLIAAFDRAWSRWPERRRWVVAAASVTGACAGLVAGVGSLGGSSLGGLAGAVLGAPALLLLRRAPGAAPLALAGGLALLRLQAAVQGAHAAQPLGASVSALLLLAAGLAWARRLSSPAG